MILAGPAVNLLIAFVIVWALLSVPAARRWHRSSRSPRSSNGTPAASLLKPGDQIVSVDGVAAVGDAIRKQIVSHRCAGAQVDGCRAADAGATSWSRRDGKLDLQLHPRYEAPDHRRAGLRVRRA